MLPDESPYPASYGQTFDFNVYEHLPPNSCNEAYGLIADGFQIAELNTSLNEIVSRHEALRTHLGRTKDGSVEAHIAAAKAIEITEQPIDRDFFGLDLETLAAEVFPEVLSSNFDWMEPDSEQPLIRATVLKQPSHSLLVVAAPSTVVDASSYGTIFEELLGAKYGNAGRPIPVPPFSDFARWQREHLQGARRKELEDFWHGYLDGLPMLKPRSAKPRPEVATRDAALARHWVPADHWNTAVAVARAERATPFMLLTAIIEYLLAVDSESEDFTLVSDLANRSRPEFQRTVGPFVSPVLLRSVIPRLRVRTLRNLLHAVRDDLFRVLRNQDLAFPLVLDTLGSDLINLMDSEHVSAVINMPPVVTTRGVQKGQSGIRGPTASQAIQLDTAVGTGHANVDLDVHAFAAPSPDLCAGPEPDLCFQVKYSAERFDADTIDELVARILTILEVGCRDPDARLPVF